MFFYSRRNKIFSKKKPNKQQQTNQTRTKQQQTPTFMSTSVSLQIIYLF